MREEEYSYVTSLELRDMKFVIESIEVTAYLKDIYKKGPRDLAPIRNYASGRITFVHEDYLRFGFNWVSSWNEGRLVKSLNTGMSIFDLDLQANFRLLGTGEKIDPMDDNLPPISFWTDEVVKMLIQDYISKEVEIL
jgi:hypothetical protein